MSIECTKRMAKATLNESADAPIGVGSYLWVLDTGLKFDHGKFRHLISEMVEFAQLDSGERKRDYPTDGPFLHHKVVEVIRIEEVPEGFFDKPDCLANWVPQPDEGGCSMDDDAEEKARTLGDYSGYWTLAVMVREPSGRMVLIDPEGYSYPRYVFTRLSWRRDFADIVADETRKLKERDEAKRREAEEAAAERRRIKAETEAKYRDIVPCFGCEGWDYGAARRNLKALLKHEFPGVKFGIRKSYARDTVEIEWTDGPADISRVTDLFGGLYADSFGKFNNKYITRHYSPEHLDAAMDIMLKHFKTENGWDDRSRVREMNEAFDHTDLPKGCKIVGLGELPPPEGHTISTENYFITEPSR